MHIQNTGDTWRMKSRNCCRRCRQEGSHTAENIQIVNKKAEDIPQQLHNVETARKTTVTAARHWPVVKLRELPQWGLGQSPSR